MTPSGYACSERLGWPAWTHVIFGAGVGLCTFGGARVLAESLTGLLPLFLAVVMTLVWWRLRYLRIEAGPRGLAFGFGKGGRVVPADRILSLEPERYSFARYMGWGYRMGWKPRERAYSLIGYGRGLRVRFLDQQGREWDVFLSCRDPEALIKAVEE
jgi:hypothetical protein